MPKIFQNLMDKLLSIEGVTVGLALGLITALVKAFPAVLSFAGKIVDAISAHWLEYKTNKNAIKRIKLENALVVSSKTDGKVSIALAHVEAYCNDPDDSLKKMASTEVSELTNMVGGRMNDYFCELNKNIGKEITNIPLAKQSVEKIRNDNRWRKEHNIEDTYNNRYLRRSTIIRIITYLGFQDPNYKGNYTTGQRK